MGGDAEGYDERRRDWRRAREFGSFLAALRNARGMTLREVEEATHKKVSNAYVSQLENGRVLQPSPDVLHTLSKAYETPYAKLMERAGYVVPDGKQAATFATEELTAEEEAELLEYLAWIRQKRKK